MSDNKRYRIGPCWIFTAPNVTDPFDQWTNLGYTQGNVIATFVNGKVILNRVDQLGNMPLAAATYKFGDSFELSMPLVDKQIDTMLKAVPGAVKITGSATDVFALGEGMDFISGEAFALVPVDEYTEGSPWWDAEHAIYMFKGYANVADQLDIFKEVEEDDLGAYEVTVTHVDDQNGRGGIGALWRLGVDVVGFADTGSFSYGVTNSDTRDALNADGIDSMKALYDATTINISAHTPLLTETTGLRYGLYNVTDLNVSNNDFSQQELSDFVHEMWLVRTIMGANNCVIDLSGNNGLNTQATSEVSDLESEGCTVTT
ncbi:hypothetical protein [Fodinibius sp.]|uniref:hypothetical protein n=1 Tax=Fodinibius sp. TaxID=1872440 RepID=UPI002ACE96E1|nr:hypothetical protein [Fodinibius sp.]MDZ7658085.1 hypothetical protein [Fodinibius sp.]